MLFCDCLLIPSCVADSWSQALELAKIAAGIIM